MRNITIVECIALLNSFSWAMHDDLVLRAMYAVLHTCASQQIQAYVNTIKSVDRCVWTGGAATAPADRRAGGPTRATVPALAAPPGAPMLLPEDG